MMLFQCFCITCSSPQKRQAGWWLSIYVCPTVPELPAAPELPAVPELPQLPVPGSGTLIVGAKGSVAVVCMRAEEVDSAQGDIVQALAALTPAELARKFSKNKYVVGVIDELNGLSFRGGSSM